jgi:hypothetical protein
MSVVASGRLISLSASVSSSDIAYSLHSDFYGMEVVDLFFVLFVGF